MELAEREVHEAVQEWSVVTWPTFPIALPLSCLQNSSFSHSQGFALKCVPFHAHTKSTSIPVKTNFHLSAIALTHKKLKREWANTGIVLAVKREQINKGLISAALRPGIKGATLNHMQWDTLYWLNVAVLSTLLKGNGAEFQLNILMILPQWFELWNVCGKYSTKLRPCGNTVLILLPADCERAMAQQPWRAIVWKGTWFIQVSSLWQNLKLKWASF